MLIRKTSALALASLILANCATAPGEESYCSRNTALCVAAGVIAVGALVAVGISFSNSAKDSPYISDLRLKRDVRPVETPPNGLRLYSFRYWNDDRIFVGVMAQDLSEDERFSHAVIEDETGYYMVDLAALGLGVEGDVEQFLEAGRAAVAKAEPVVN